MTGCRRLEMLTWLAAVPLETLATPLLKRSGGSSTATRASRVAPQHKLQPCMLRSSLMLASSWAQGMPSLQLAARLRPRPWQLRPLAGCLARCNRRQARPLALRCLVNSSSSSRSPRGSSLQGAGSPQLPWAHWGSGMCQESTGCHQALCWPVLLPHACKLEVTVCQQLWLQQQQLIKWRPSRLAAP
jgi:hypothetical protein